MSMIDRLLRAIDTMSNLGLDGVERGGMQGEQYAESIIDGGQNGCYVRNPIIPHPRKLGDARREGAFSAHDNILVTYVNGGTQLFECISGEIHLKRFKGEQQVHKLRNVNKLVVGIANKVSISGYML